MVPGCLQLGTAGVELFFVLSGFLIGSIFCQKYLGVEEFKKKDLLNFWNRRWWRTLPNYFLFLILHFFWAWNLNGEMPSLGSLCQHAIFLQNFAWPIEGFFGISWSLAIEEWFYLLFPVAVLSLGKLMGQKPSTIFLSASLFLVLSFYWRMTQSMDNWDSEIRKPVIGRLDSLQLGVILSLVKLHFAKWWSKLKWVGVLGIPLFSSLILYSHQHYLAGEKMLISPAVLFLLWPFSVMLMLPSFFFLPSPGGRVQRVVEFISKTSYSVYLCHLPIKYIVADLFGSIPIWSPVFFLSKIITILVIFGFSFLVFQYFEKPFTSFRKSNCV